MRKGKRRDCVGSGTVQVRLGLESLCRQFAHAGEVYLDALTLAIEDAAPRPGYLICLQAKKLSMSLNGLEPVLFSAIDVNTHLQVARVYLTMTRAAAVDFVDFVSQSLPFPPFQIKTLAAAPFAASPPDSCGDFSSAMKARGFEHLALRSPADDVLFSLLTKLTFGGAPEQSFVPSSKDDLHAELARFLFFHNNYRSLPWLGGKTPLQKLNTYRRFAEVHSFDPIGFFGVGDRRGRAHQHVPEKQERTAAIDEASSEKIALKG